MQCIYDYLEKRGYNISTSYYTFIEKWIDIWKGKAEWLNIKTVNDKEFPMYSLGMGKKVCEDLASTITSEPFNIKAKKNDEILQKDLKNAKVLEKMAEIIETVGYTGTVGTVSRIVNATINGEGERATLSRGSNTKIKTINIKANQIIPLTIEDGEIINCAFVSEQKKRINGEMKEILYLEIHELEERGYQVTNVYFDKESKEEILVEGIVNTYNTLSNIPLFTILKLPKVNPIDDNNGLGICLFGSAIDQLMLLDLVYNNFGMDFKLGQKIIILNKKLTRIETEEYTDKDGQIKQRQKVVYPSDLQKQLFTEVSDGVMGNPNDKPYIYEYNPDLRVGDNKAGVQFALNNLSFKIDFGTDYYNFENGKVYTNTMSITTSRKDFVDNMNKIRKVVNEYLKGVCKSILLCEKMLGDASIDENQEIEVTEVDGFLLDDESVRQKLLEDYSAGLITQKRYLKKVYNMTDEEALKEIAEINEQNSISNINLNDEPIIEE